MWTPKRILISIGQRPPDLEIAAEVHPDAPGLAVHGNIEGSGAWKVTHIKSGCAVATLGTPPIAKAVAVALAPLGDWTAGLPEDVDQDIVSQVVAEVEQAHRGRR